MVHRAISFKVENHCTLDASTIRGMIASYAAALDDKNKWQADTYCTGKVYGLVLAFAHVGITLERC